MQFKQHVRLQTKDGILEYLGDITETTYENWRKKGITPGPVPGTNRYDVKAHDGVLDGIQGLKGSATKQGALSSLEGWLENARSG